MIDNKKEFENYINRGNDYFIAQNDPLSAIKCYEKALAINPDDVKTKVCLAISYLKVKIFAKGWEFFENRYPASNDLAKPIWKGESIQDKTLYVYYEAGFGDSIMFARFLPLLKDKCKKVLFRPQTELVKLFQDSDLGVEIISKKTKSIDMDFDFHIPMRSLPYALKINEEKDIPKSKYLQSNEIKVKFYKAKYFNNEKLKIGINWHGNSVSDDTRQIDFKFFESFIFEAQSKLSQHGDGGLVNPPYFADLTQALIAPQRTLPNVQVYSLQTDTKEELPENFIDLGATFSNFSDTAAAIENLDLV